MELVEHSLAAKSAESVADVLSDRNVTSRHFAAKFVGDHFWAARSANTHVVAGEPQSVCDACFCVKDAFGAAFGEVEATVDRANSWVVAPTSALELFGVRDFVDSSEFARCSEKRDCHVVCTKSEDTLQVAALSEQIVRCFERLVADLEIQIICPMKVARSWLADASGLDSLYVESFWEHGLAQLGNIWAVEDEFGLASELYTLENISNINIACR